MEVLPWLQSGAAILLAAVALLLLKNFLVYPRRRFNRPPGPKPWPIIGNLNLIGALPYRSFHDLSQQYGPIMLLYFGSAPVVVASSAEMAKLFLKTHDFNFASRADTVAGKHSAYDHSNIAWAPYGPYWRETRKICIHEVFGAKQVDASEYIRTEELMAIVSDIFASCGKPITLKEYYTDYILRSISRTLLGNKDFVGKSSPSCITTPKELKEMLQEWEFLNTGVFNIGDFIPWLNFLDLQGYIKQTKVLHKKIDHFLEHVVDEHSSKRQGLKDFRSEDLVDVLLKFADDPNHEVKFSKTKIKGIILGLLAAANPTASTLEWAMSELLKHPEIIKQANEELDQVIGKNRWVEEKDIQHLPYLEAIMKETMRMSPVTPTLAPHFSRADWKVAGYDIVAGTRIFINIWSIGRDPTLWDAPDEFRPERFIGSDIDVKGNHFELLPFGSGRRMCPAYTLGLKMVQCGLANLLHGFNWKLVDDMKLPQVVVPQPRLPIHLYP